MSVINMFHYKMAKLRKLFDASFETDENGKTIAYLQQMEALVAEEKEIRIRRYGG